MGQFFGSGIREHFRASYLEQSGPRLPSWNSDHCIWNCGGLGSHKHMSWECRLKPSCIPCPANPLVARFGWTVQRGEQGRALQQIRCWMVRVQTEIWKVHHPGRPPGDQDGWPLKASVACRCFSAAGWETVQLRRGLASFLSSAKDMLLARLYLASFVGSAKDMLGAYSMSRMSTTKSCM